MLFILLLLPPSDCVEEFLVIGTHRRVVVVLVHRLVRCRCRWINLLVMNRDVGVIWRSRRGRWIDVGVERLLLEVRLMALNVIWCVAHGAWGAWRVWRCWRKRCLRSGNRLQLRTFRVVWTCRGAGTCGIFIVQHVLQAANIFNCELQCVHLAQLLCRSATAAFGELRNNCLRDVLAQIGKSIVHLLHAISFACVASLHRNCLTRRIRHRSVIVLLFWNIDHLISAIRCEHGGCRCERSFAKRCIHLLTLAGEHVGRYEHTIVRHWHHVNILSESHCTNLRRCHLFLNRPLNETL